MVQWIRERRLLLQRWWLMFRESPQDREVRVAVERLIAGVQNDG